MRKKISFAQLVVGSVFGLVIVLGVMVGVGYLYFMRLSQTPSKPSYPEISAEDQKKSKELANVSDEASGATDSSYVSLVVYKDGLLMRESPDSSAKVVTKLNFEETVRILAKSPDEQWEKVLLETTGQSGWVRRGNTQPAR